MRVLEVGTGTGWNAAILATLVGQKGAVTSIEIDPGVAALARERLEGLGVHVRTAALPPAGQAYDAVIATCAATQIPTEWLDAAEQGAPLVLPWSPHPSARSTPVVALRKDAQRGAGTFVREAAFMRDRTQRPGNLPFPGLGQRPTHSADFPAGSVELIGSGMMTQLMLMLPGVRLGTGVRPFHGGHGRIVWMGTAESWAYIWPDGTITGGGERPLGDTLAHAYRQLQDAGLPELESFLLEADPGCGSYRVTCSAMDQEWIHHVLP
jgi:hypothetical protein